MLRPFKEKRPSITDASIADIIGEQNNSTEVSQGRRSQQEQQELLRRQQNRRDEDTGRDRITGGAPPSIPKDSGEPEPPKSLIINDLDELELHSDFEGNTCNLILEVSFEEGTFPSEVQPGMTLFDISEDKLRSFGAYVSEQSGITSTDVTLLPGFVASTDKDGNDTISFIVFTRFYFLGFNQIEGLKNSTISFLDDEFDAGEELEASMIAYDAPILNEDIEERDGITLEHTVLVNH